MAQPPETPRGPPAGPSPALAVVAAELGALNHRIARLEIAIGEMASTRTDRRLVVAFQDIDLVRQSLEDLERVVAALARAPAASRETLSAVVRLGELRERLLTGAAAAGTRPRPGDGEIAFF